MNSANNNLVDPDVLSQLPNLILRVKSVTAYVNRGLHRSMYHGSSIEFSEHKLYSPGDEPKWIDWKFYAKTDRFYIKQFENESSLSAYLLIDSSASMGYKGIDGKGFSKLDYASILLASLAYILIEQRDKAGLVSCSGGSAHLIPAGRKSGHLNLIIKKLEGLAPTKGKGLASSINLLSEKLRKRGIVVIISDLLEDENSILKSLKLLKQRKQKIFLLHILHHSELAFPFTKTMQMFDMETDTQHKITVEPSRVRDNYLKALEGYITWWKKESMINAIEYHLVDTSKPVHIPLIEMLSLSR